MSTTCRYTRSTRTFHRSGFAQLHRRPGLICQACDLVAPSYVGAARQPRLQHLNGGSVLYWQNERRPVTALSAQEIGERELIYEPMDKVCRNCSCPGCYCLCGVG